MNDLYELINDSLISVNCMFNFLQRIWAQGSLGSYDWRCWKGDEMLYILSMTAPETPWQLSKPADVSRHWGRRHLLSAWQIPALPCLHCHGHPKPGPCLLTTCPHEKVHSLKTWLGGKHVCRVAKQYPLLLERNGCSPSFCLIIHLH